MFGRNLGMGNGFGSVSTCRSYRKLKCMCFGKHFEWKKKQSCLYFNSKLAHTFLMGVGIKDLVSEPVFALVESIAIDTCINKKLPGGLIITKYIL